MNTLLFEPARAAKRKIPGSWQIEERWLFYPTCALRMKYDPYCGQEGEFTEWCYEADNIRAHSDLSGYAMLEALDVVPKVITSYDIPDFGGAYNAFHSAVPLSVEDATHRMLGIYGAKGGAPDA